jgi:hypothetical protein
MKKYAECVELVKQVAMIAGDEREEWIKKIHKENIDGQKGIPLEKCTKPTTYTELIEQERGSR